MGLHVAGKLRNDSARLSQLGSLLSKSTTSDYFQQYDHTSVIAGLADCYKQAISTLNFNIQVLGHGEHLRNEQTAARIRSCLLFGVRSAILWHQLGGRRWHLLFKRKQMVKQARLLLAETV